jgi:mannose/cellobiose epimerase-like protein (N-acyl-D-glucosamine 2-epimerase family)
MWDHSRLREWLVAETLPLWLDKGCDRRDGGFHEKLNFHLTPITDEGKRIMVQARQCYVFAMFADELLEAPNAAASGFNFMLSHGAHPEGGWRHRVARDGSPKDDSRDLYDQAFVLFAAAWMHATFGWEDALSAADDTLEYLDARRVHPSGGYSEKILAGGGLAEGPRRQNPHMHLFEAVLALFDATGDDAYLARAEALFDLARTKFIVDGTLREYFTDGLDPVQGTMGTIVEPGHHMEWVWLLHRYAALTDDSRAVETATGLYTFALDHGYDATSGGLLDEVTSNGAVRRDSRRLWPQTEALKGHLVRLERADGGAAAARVGAGLDSLSRHHLVGGGGNWHEHIRADGTNFYGSLPASSLYHLSFAVAELDRVGQNRP